LLRLRIKGWGGFESLVIPADPAADRTADPWDRSGYLLRYHIGLEDPQDLISDLAEGFQRLDWVQSNWLDNAVCIQ
jgi:cystathionine beta-lyase